MCLQETHIHINHCSIEQHNGFWFLFSSEISNPLVENAVREFARIGFIISPEMWRFVVKFDAVNSRVARLSLRCHGNPVHLFSVYAPHSGRPSCDKEQFHQNLRMNLRRIPDAEIRFIFGAFNARLHFVQDEDRPQVGPHVLGRGFDFFKQRIPQHSGKLGSFCRFFKSLCTYSEV